MNCPHCDRPLDEAAATITRLVTERDEAREGLDRLEAAYGSLSDDVFSARPKIAAMAKELSEAKAQRDRVVERLSPRMASIVADVAAAHGVPLAEMMSRSRCRQDVEARQEAMWRCREVRINSGRHRYSLQQIGQFFKRNHATIIFACQRHLDRTSK